MRKIVTILFIILLCIIGIPLIMAPAYADPPQRGIWVDLPRNVYFADKTLYVYIRGVDYGDLTETFNQVESISYKKVVIDLFSFGGSVFDALAIVGLLEDQQRQGRIVEIRARGIVASAGLILMMSGSPGHRFIDSQTFVMFHEMQSFKFFAIESVSDQEEQAKINRKIQDAINKYVTSKTKLTPGKLSEMIKRKELWVDAQGAVEYGFADKIIGK